MRLPPNPTLTWLLSFWCTANVVLALLVAFPAALIWSPAASASMLVAVGLVGAFGLLRPEAAATAYRGWNGLATKYSTLARACILRVSFLVLTSASPMRRGARWPRPVPAHSSWEPKRSSGVDTYERANGSPATPAWIARYVSWSRRSDNLWSLCLLPFVILLLALETKDDGSLPERLYTLY